METNIQKIVAEIIASGMTQTQLAELVPCGQSTINGYLNGQRGKQVAMPIGMRLLEIHASVVKRRKRRK